LYELLNDHKKQQQNDETAADRSSSSLFDVVIIDEAAQALEIACWLPISLGTDNNQWFAFSIRKI
jgi:superfamily I DNA and/or RNA helicase